MKKYLTPIVAIVLMAISFFAAVGYGTSEIGRKGNGTNVTVKNLDDLREIFDFVLEQKEGKAEEAGLSAIHLFSFDQYEEKEEKNSKYSGVTLVEESVIDSSIVHLNRSLTLYLTDKASYYISKGTLLISYEHTDFYMIFDAEFYIEGQNALMKFNDLVIEYGNKEIDEQYLGKWLMTETGEAEKFLAFIDDMNENALKEFADYLQEKDDADFKKDGKTYTGKTDFLGFEADIVYDLSNGERPIVEISGNDAKSYIYDSVVFYNIDNTVIDTSHIEEDDILTIESLNEFIGTKGD